MELFHRSLHRLPNFSNSLSLPSFRLFCPFSPPATARKEGGRERERSVTGLSMRGGKGRQEGKRPPRCRDCERGVFHAPLTPLPPAGVALSARFHFAPFGCCVCSLAEGRGGKVRFEVRGMEGDGFAACPIWCRVVRRGRREMGDFCSLSLPPEKKTLLIATSTFIWK